MLARTAPALGDLVRTRRESLGWSQQRLADEMGASRLWVSEFENGKGNARVRLLLDALNVLGLVVDVHEDERRA